MTNLLLCVAMISLVSRGRDHEHHARLGHRAHARDRPAHGRGRARAGHPAAVSGGGRGPLSGGRRRGNLGGARRIAPRRGPLRWPVATSLPAIPPPSWFRPAWASFSDSIRPGKRRVWTPSTPCATSEFVVIAHTGVSDEFKSSSVGAASCRDGIVAGSHSTKATLHDDRMAPNAIACF